MLGCFWLQFAVNADLVHVVHEDKEFLDWLQNIASFQKIKNISTFISSVDHFEPNEYYDLIFMKDDFQGLRTDYESRIKKALGLMEVNGKLYITGPGFGNLLIKIIMDARIGNLKGVWESVKNLFITILCNKIPFTKKYPKSFFSQKEFSNLLKKNGLKFGNVGVVDTILEGVSPCKVGPFARKWEVICEKNNSDCNSN